MASFLVELFQSRMIELYPDPDLLSDLGRLRIKPTPTAWRLDAARTAQGHADRASALTLAVLGARRAPPDSGSDGLNEIAFFCPGYRGFDALDYGPGLAASLGDIRTFGRDEHNRTRYTGGYDADEDPGHGVSFGYRPYSG
jgi:hypothetical protein